MTVTNYKNDIIKYFERKCNETEMNKDSHSDGIGYQYDGIRKALDNVKTFQGEIVSGDQAKGDIVGIGTKLAQEIQDLIDSL
jgi:DNA polymerase/3'-5' exonuclease PolX